MNPSQFWTALNAAEQRRKVQITSAREIRATGNHLAAQNDEPEPLGAMSPAMREEYERGQAIARDVMRSPLRARDLMSAQDEGQL